jgi:phosphomannomutase
MITFTFFNGCRATLRTSGTEPKVKYYAEMVGRPRVRRDSESANVNQGEEEEFDLPEEKRKVKEELDKVIHAIVLEWFDL